MESTLEKKPSETGGGAYSKLTARFKSNPTMFYAASIVASWAGVGSLLNFRTLALNNGAVPAITWAFGNTLACILFGLLVAYIPHIRKIMKTKVMAYFIGFLTVFQIWTQMSGIRTVFEDTPIGGVGGMVLAYGIAVAFIVILWRRGMIRNVLTDSGSWIVVYGLLVIVTVAAFAYTNGQFNEVQLGLEPNNVRAGIINGLLLLPGPFTYPYFYTIFEYNDSNEDGTAKANVKLSFVFAGLMFGVYMVLAAALTWVQFSPELNILKAILITIVAASSITTYVYSEYVVFGKKGGLAVNIGTVAGWYFLIPLGVMGIWQLMSSIRWIIVLGVIAVAIGMLVKEKMEARKCDES